MPAPISSRTAAEEFSLLSPGLKKKYAIRRPKASAPKASKSFSVMPSRKQPDGKNCQRHRAAEGERILIGELGRRHLADSITQGKMTSRIRSTFTRPSTSLTIIQPQRVVSNL